MSDFEKEYPYQAPVIVRWSDLDELKMVNNAVFMTYLEEARVPLFLDMLQWNWREQGVVVASVTLNYKMPIVYGNKPVVYIRCKEIGNSSFVLENIIAEKDGNGGYIIFADATVKMVAYDLVKRKASPLMPHVIENLKSIQVKSNGQ